VTGTIRCALVAVMAVISFSSPTIASAQSAPSPSPAPSGSSPGSPGAPGGGGMPIEATILAYQGLQADADGIASAVKATLASPSVQRKKIVVATPADIVALLQLRIVLSQVATLNERLNELRSSLYRSPCAPPPAAVQNTRANASWISPVLGLFSSPSDISAMVSTIASFTSSSVTVSGQSGNFVDGTLMNMVAESLNENAQPVSVYVPGVVPPNISTIPPSPADKGSIVESSRTQSYLYQGLRTLEQNRTLLESQVWAAYNNPKKPKCKKDPTLAALAKLVAAAAKAGDDFEAAILGGSLKIPSTALLPSPPSAPSTPSKGKSGGGSGSSVSNTININPPSPAAPSGPSGPSALQQLLYVDLLLHELSYGEPCSQQGGGLPCVYELRDVYMLSVHALESGGSQLTKNQTFLGTRQYFSGGAAATFTLVNYAGAMVCSGLVYGYRGFIKADDIGLAVTPRIGNGNPAIVPGTQNALPNGQAYGPGTNSSSSPPRVGGCNG
jgi:hypothetical protein